MGFIKDNKLLILSPQKKIAQFQTDFSTGLSNPTPLSNELSKQAIAWYQGASFLFKTHRYTLKK
jgi:hypothetical protein